MTTSFQLLLVEDNQADIDLIRECLETSQQNVDLTIAYDGIAALATLHNRDIPPHLIILDLNLPKKDGRATLAEIKSSPHFKKIPVIVLTSSQAESDVLKSYELGANCYVTKPLSFRSFQSLIHLIEQFWLATAILPPYRATGLV